MLLARTMGMTAEELTMRMGAEEFVEHMAYYAIDPWGEHRADLRSGIIASLLHNIHKIEGAEAKTPRDYLLFQPVDEEAEAEKNRRQFMARQAARLKKPGRQ